MNDVEAALAALLSDRAGRVEPAPGHRTQTLRGARRRRVETVAGAVVVALALAGGGLGAVRAFEDSPALRPAAPDSVIESSGSYGFTSRPGEYPFAATGEFRDTEWQLRVAAVSPPRGNLVRITLQVQGRARGMATASAQVPRVDPIFVRYEHGSWLFDGDVAMVFGAVDPDAETVDIWLRGIDHPDRTLDAHLFEGYDAKTGLRADYYLAFLPAQRYGLVIAKDANGDEVGAAVIPQR